MSEKRLPFLKPVRSAAIYNSNALVAVYLDHYLALSVLYTCGHWLLMLQVAEAAAGQQHMPMASPATTYLHPKSMMETRYGPK